MADRIVTDRSTYNDSEQPIIRRDMLRMGQGTGSEAAPRSDLVLLCGGTERQRELARARNAGLIGGSEPVVVGDLESLVRCASSSRAVIVCGGLSGMSVYVIERLVRQRAPYATLVRADRATEQGRPTMPRGRRVVLRRLLRAAALQR